MFEVGSSVAFRAFHRMPDHPPPENERHSHDYRIDVVVERPGLNDQGMVCDLDVLNRCLEELAARGRDRDLSELCGPDAVTVEMLASWFHDGLAGTMKREGVEVLRVRAWESGDAFGGRRERLT
jgi:6-pyruvoyltetrahydropterin/6-carboxytetrahydropterin synthase